MEKDMLTTSDRPAQSRLAVITGEGGLRFAADIRGHRIITDQPQWAGGEDVAAMPLELLSASLGTCVALYAHQFCASRGIPHEGLRVEVRTESATNPKRIGRFDVRVILPDSLPEQYRPAIERAVRTCPVHNTLMHAPVIDVDIVEPVIAV
jgi:putative redox protein